MDKNKLKEKAGLWATAFIFCALWGSGFFISMCASETMLSVYLLVSSLALVVEYYYVGYVKKKELTSVHKCSKCGYDHKKTGGKRGN